jgi:hypothetical protein
MTTPPPTDPPARFPPPLPLATQADYEELIGPSPTPAENVARLAVYLAVAAVIVYGKAYLLLTSDIQDGTTPIPKSATLITCQVASALMANPGGIAAVTMERVGYAETQYSPDNDPVLPGYWREALKPWRLPDFAAIKLHQHVPPVGYLQYWWDSWFSDLDPDAPEYPWSGPFHQPLYRPAFR